MGVDCVAIAVAVAPGFDGVVCGVAVAVWERRGSSSAKVSVLMAVVWEAESGGLSETVGVGGGCRGVDGREWRGVIEAGSMV